MGKSEKGAPLPVDPVLPPGPGLRRRWLMAAPLLLLATVLPGSGAVLLGAWIRFSDNYSPFDKAEPSFAVEFGKSLSLAWTPVAVAALVLLVVLVRGKFAPWPGACLLTAAVAMAPAAFISLAIELSADTLANASLALGLVLLNYWLGRAALWVLSRPVAADLVASNLEIPYFVPGSTARLRIQGDRLRLDRWRQRSRTRNEIRWSALDRVAVENSSAATSWTAGDGTVIDVPAGPVLRIKGKSEEWLIPVPDVLGEDLATAIAIRANARRA